MQTPPFSSSDVIEQMQQLLPPGSPAPESSEMIAQLQTLTADLVRAYQAAGRLQEDPFQEARSRSLLLNEAEVRARLQGKVVLVTGGEGCVGSHLIRKLAEFDVQRIISVDKARRAETSSEVPIASPHPGVIYYAADLRDEHEVESIFQRERPAIVFHVAAQRHPGLAEKLIHETITSNVFGTQAIIRLCEAYGVEQCIFSSTGKASRYFTAEVYAASKKMAEWLLAEAAGRGQVRFGMVRFTHMLENSSMCEQIDHKICQGLPINIHAPDRYVVGQNVGEAVHLLLNALLYSEQNCLKFGLVRHLGWPAESLEVALYKLIQSGKQLPIYFEGVLPGYEESFFLGQVDWEEQLDINTLINALETGYNSSISASGDMIVAELVPFSTAVLDQQLAMLNTLCQDRTVPEQALKQELATAVRAIALSSFLQAAPPRLLQILKWGVNPKQFQRGELKLADYQEILTLLLQAMTEQLTLEMLPAANLSEPEFAELLDILFTLPAIQPGVAALRTRLAGLNNQAPEAKIVVSV
jgi:hypothetical protein